MLLVRNINLQKVLVGLKKLLLFKKNIYIFAVHYYTKMVAGLSATSVDKAKKVHIKSRPD